MLSPEPDRFERDTSVTAMAKGRYAARIDPGWWVIQGPNGGYIAAILQRAICASVGDPQRTPRSLTVHYTAPPVVGEAEIETRIERSGRSLSSVSARLSQDGRLCALALAAVSAPRKGIDFVHTSPPRVPPAADLTARPSLLPINERYETRFAPSLQPLAGGEEAVVAAWIRAREPHALDHALLAAYADALPPAVFTRATHEGEFGALPTVDLTVHYRCEPAQAKVGPADFCLAVFRSRVARGGFIEEDGEVWSPDGQLLAQSRQLAVILGR